MTTEQAHTPDTVSFMDPTGKVRALITRLNDRLEAYEAALREIASIWNERHEAKIAEYVGAGTEAFEDVAYVDALALQLPCSIARKALGDA